MRFRAELRQVTNFSKLAASLAAIGPIAWLRLDEETVGFTVIPDQGTQVWAVLSIESLFSEEYTVQSNSNNCINLEVPLALLQRALRSAVNAQSAVIRLTKKNDRPVLSLTVKRSCSTAIPGSNAVGPLSHFAEHHSQALPDGTALLPRPHDGAEPASWEASKHREATIVQDIPVRVLAPSVVNGLHQPHCRDPDVHIFLPPLAQLKAVSDRFTRLAVNPKGSDTGYTGFEAGPGPSTAPSASASANTPKLEMAANMHGCLRLRLKMDSVSIQTVWTGLVNPELNPDSLGGGQESLRDHPSTRMKQLGDPTGQSELGWATVRIDGRDWGKVLSVGRLGGKVVACFCDQQALILYVYLQDERGDHESVLTYYIGSFSE